MEQPKPVTRDVCLVYPIDHAHLPPPGPRDVDAATNALREGLSMAERGDHARAVAAYQAALDRDELLGLAHLAMGESLWIVGFDPKRMRHHLASAVVLLPSNPRAHLRLADFALEVGEPRVAATHWDCALTLNPTYAEARFHRARYLTLAGRAPEAEAELRRVVDEGLRDVAVLVSLAEAMEAQGRVLEAAQQLEAAAKDAKTSAALYRRAGDLYQRASSPLSARRVRAVADRLDPPPEDRPMRPLAKRRKKK